MSNLSYEAILNRLAYVRASFDFNGRVLTEGCTVRVFNAVTYSESEGISGMSIQGEKAFFCEGVLEEIGLRIDGTLRYRVRAMKVVVGGREIPVTKEFKHIYPEQNGLKPDGTVRFDVCRFEPKAERPTDRKAA